MKMMLNTSNLEEAIRHVKNWKYRPPVIEVDKAKAAAIARRICLEGENRFKYPGLTLEAMQKGIEQLRAL